MVVISFLVLLIQTKYWSQHSDSERWTKFNFVEFAFLHFKLVAIFSVIKINAVSLADVIPCGESTENGTIQKKEEKNALSHPSNPSVHIANSVHKNLATCQRFKHVRKVFFCSLFLFLLFSSYIRFLRATLCTYTNDIPTDKLKT